MNKHRPNFSHFVTIALWLAITWNGFAKDSHARMIYDRIVGVAAGEPVLLSEVRKKVEKGPLVFISEFPSSTTDTLFDRALHDALNFVLIKNAAKARNIEVDDEDVDQHIVRITQQQNATIDDLKEFLKAQGMSYEQYRHDLKDQILWQKFQARVLLPKVRVSDRHLKEHYQMSYARSADDIHYDLEALFVSSKKLAEILYTKFAAGELPLKAMRNTDLLNKVLDNHQMLLQDELRYDNMGKIHHSELSKATSELLQDLDIGSFSPPLAVSDQGFYIFYIKSKTITEKPHFVAQKEELRRAVRAQEMRVALKAFLLKERGKEALFLAP